MGPGGELPDAEAAACAAASNASLRARGTCNTQPRRRAGWGRERMAASPASNPQPLDSVMHVVGLHERPALVAADGRAGTWAVGAVDARAAGGRGDAPRWRLRAGPGHCGGNGKVEAARQRGEQKAFALQGGGFTFACAGAAFCCHRARATRHNFVLYSAHETHTRVGRSTAHYEHEVVTGNGDTDTDTDTDTDNGEVDTLLQATR